MKKFIQKTFALTENGAKGMTKAAIASFFSNIAYMIPFMLILFFAQQILETNLLYPYYVYIIAILLLLILLYFPTNISYHSTYNETYKEAANLRFELANIIKRVPLSFFSKHDVSDISQTLMRDVGDIEHAMSHAVPQSLGILFFSAIVLVLLIVFNPILGATIAVPIILSLLLLFLSKKLQSKNTAKYHAHLRENANSFQHAIELQQEIKSFNLQKSVKEDLYKKIDLSEKLQLKAEVSQFIPVALSSSILKLTIGATILMGINLYTKEALSLLYLIGYIFAAIRLTDTIDGVFLYLSEIFYLDARIKGIATLRNAKINEGKKVTFDNYDIKFDNVTFGYNQNDVIKNLSFVAKQNQVTALVGPSGCGKTTLLRLISGLYSYDSGSITIGSHDIKGIDEESLYEKISVVFQDVMLFNISVMENIRIGNKDASDAQVIAAAKLANAHQFIQKLPDKYNTLVGENGSRLSGGERQRISIARAFLKNAPIIILDEISASMDAENEMNIQESLSTLIKNKTVLIISHRLKAIEKVDQIVLLEDGRCSATGEHKDLIKKSNLYKKMWQRFSQAEKFIY